MVGLNLLFGDLSFSLCLLAAPLPSIQEAQHSPSLEDDFGREVGSHAIPSGSWGEWKMENIPSLPPSKILSDGQNIHWGVAQTWVGNLESIILL